MEQNHLPEFSLNKVLRDVSSKIDEEVKHKVITGRTASILKDTISTYLNNNTVLSYTDASFIGVSIIRLQTQIYVVLLDDDYLGENLDLNKVNLLTNNIVDAIQLALLRAYKGEEKKLLLTHMSISTSFGEEEQRGGRLL